MARSAANGATGKKPPRTATPPTSRGSIEQRAPDHDHLARLSEQLIALGASRSDVEIEVFGDGAGPELRTYGIALAGMTTPPDRYAPAANGGRLIPAHGSTLSEVIARQDGN